MGRGHGLDPWAPWTLDIPAVLTFGKMPERVRAGLRTEYKSSCQLLIFKLL